MFLIRCLAIFLVVVGVSSRAQSAVYVFLDFGGGFDAALDSLYGPTFSASDKTEIKDLIELKMAAAYSAFDITFSQVTSGGSEDVIDFDETLDPDSLPAVPSGLLGWATQDWNNLGGFHESNVLTANFVSSLDETPPLAMAKMEIATSLAGTAAHELGHSYGLRHYDSYGDPSIASLAATGGAQNGFLMATGPTGITEADRETDRLFTRNSIAKLEMTRTGPVPLTSSPFSFGVTLESAVPHSVPLMAQDLTSGFHHLPISDTWALKMHGAGIGPGGSPSDFYKFTLATAGLFNAEILSLGRYANGVETNLTLFDSTMTPIAFGNDVYFDATSLDYSTMTGTFQQSDPLIMNLALLAGTYFLEVVPEIGGDETGPPGGFYDLYLNTDALPAMLETSNPLIPEPSTFSLLAFSVGFLAIRRRRVSTSSRKT